MEDTQVLGELGELDEQFVEAFRRGWWELLQPILASSFSYLDGATGEVWAHERYVNDLRDHSALSLAVDQVVVHIDGNTAVVSGRTSRRPESYRRYLDAYQRHPEGGSASTPASGRFDLSNTAGNQAGVVAQLRGGAGSLLEEASAARPADRPRARCDAADGA